MHFSLLLTCTRSFRLAVYSLEGEPTLIRALRSDVSFHPAALTLVPTPTGFRGELTFSTPVYPSAWTVAVQELHIPLSPLAVHRGECHHVRPALTPATDWPRRIEPVRAVRGPAGVGSDGRWCVLAGADSVMHVYALPRKHEGMVHAHTLLAPPGGVGALALAAGRCVSGGKAGARVLLWDLEEVGGEAGEAQVGTARAGYVEVRAGGRRRTEAEEVTAAQTEEGEVVFPNPRSISAAARALFLPAPPASLPAAPSVVPASGRIQQLAFDEEKIVGMEGDVMRIWSFR
jgi:hypothetical protein